MKALCLEIKKLLTEKKVTVPVMVVIFLSYIFLWTHPSMGVDDTAMPRYLVGGFLPHLGRCTLYLLEKVVHLADFTPVVIDFIGVVLMALAALIMGVIVRKSSDQKIRVSGCAVFVCFFVSYPLINEVYVYYLHNGLGIAYVLTAVTYYLLRFGSKRTDLIWGSMMLSLAIGCYETLAEVFLLLFCADTMIRILFQEKKVTWKEWFVLAIKCCVTVVAAMILKTLLARVVLWVIDVEPYFHSVGKEIKWLFADTMMQTLMSMIRSFGRYYVLNATVNYGVLMFWGAMAILVLAGVVSAVRKKSGLLLLNLVGVLGVSWVISIIEGTIGAYRTMQTFPVLVGLAMLLLYHWLSQSGRKTLVRNLGFVLLAVMLYNQVYETNKWYYVDYLKYEEEKMICHQLAYDIEKEATLDKEIIFIGRIKDYGIADAYMYVKPGSWQYRLFSRLDGTDELDKKYEIVQNPAWYAVFDWGTDAFDEHATEIANFFAYHGHFIEVATREEKWEQLEMAQSMPVWPKEGSIVETEEYVIVKLGEEAPRQQ